MGSIGHVGLVVLAFGLTILVQIRASKMRSSLGGLILPTLVFLFATCILIQDFGHIKAGIATVNALTALLYFALYNIPTILFLCIYNYYQRMRIAKSGGHES